MGLTVGTRLAGRNDRLCVQIACELVRKVKVDIPDLSIQSPVDLLGDADGVGDGEHREAQDDANEVDARLQHGLQGERGR